MFFLYTQFNFKFAPRALINKVKTSTGAKVKRQNKKDTTILFIDARVFAYKGKFEIPFRLLTRF